MLRSLGPFQPLLLAALFLMTGHGLTSTILSVRLAQMGASAPIAGLMTTAYFVGMVIGTRLGYLLLRRTGHIRGFAATVTGAAMSILLVPLIPEPMVWLLLRLFGGICIVLALLVLESWLNMTADNTSRGSVFGSYMVIAYVGMTAGQALLGVLDVGSYEAFSIAAVVMLLAVQPLALTTRLQPELPANTRLRLSDLVRISPVGIAASVASGALTGAMFGLFPFYAGAVGLGAGEIALFMSAVIGGGLVLNWPLGWLSDRVDRRYVVALAAATVVATSALLMLGERSLAILVLAGGLMGGVTGALYSLGVAHTNDNVGGADAIAVGAGLLLAFGCGAIFGPPLASLAMDFVAAEALFAYTGLIGAGLLLLTLYRTMARRAVSADDKTSFVSLANTAPASYALDPWTKDADDAPEGGGPARPL